MPYLTPEEAQRKIQERKTTQASSGATGISSGSLGGDSVLNTLLGVGTLTGDISSSQVSALQSLGILSAPQTATERKEEREEELGITSALAKLSQIEENLEKSPQAVGFGKPTQSKLFGGVSPSTPLLGLLAPSKETSFMEGIISDYNTRLFEIAGKAFTGPEKELLQGLVLSTGDSPEKMQQKINAAKTMLAQRQAVTSGNAPTVNNLLLNQNSNVAPPGSIQGGPPPTSGNLPPSLESAKKGVSSLAAPVTTLLGSIFGPIGSTLGGFLGSRVGQITERGGPATQDIQTLLGTLPREQDILSPEVQQKLSASDVAKGGPLSREQLESVGFTSIPEDKFELEKSQAASFAAWAGITHLAVDKVISMFKSGAKIADVRLKHGNQATDIANVEAKVAENVDDFLANPEHKNILQRELEFLRNQAKGGQITSYDLIGRLQQTGLEAASAGSKATANFYKSLHAAYKDILVGQGGIVPQLARPLAEYSSLAAKKKFAQEAWRTLPRIIPWIVIGSLGTKLL